MKQRCEDIAYLIGPVKIQFNSLFYFNIEPTQYLFDAAQFDQSKSGYCLFGIRPNTEQPDSD